MVRTRRRGTAIVDTPNGILVVSKDGKNFLLPGGGAWRNETEKDATIRELREETGLETLDIADLFDFKGLTHRQARGGPFRNAHRVFRVTATGTPEPREEITGVAYYDGSGPKLSYSAQKIIDRYYASNASTPAQGPQRAAQSGENQSTQRSLT